MVPDERTAIARADVQHPADGSSDYKGFSREETLRFDLQVESCVLVETKAIQEILPIHKAQLLSYMKLLNVPLGLLINFNVERVTDGVARLMLPGANR